VRSNFPYLLLTRYESEEKENDKNEKEEIEKEISILVKETEKEIPMDKAGDKRKKLMESTN